MKLGHFAVVKVGGDTTLDLVDASIDFNGQHDGFLVTKEQFYEILISRPGSRPTLPVRADARRSEFDRSLRQLKGGYFDDCTATSSKSSRTRTAAAAQKPTRCTPPRVSHRRHLPGRRSKLGRFDAENRNGSGCSRTGHGCPGRRGWAGTRHHFRPCGAVVSEVRPLLG